jgi:hypothetical protein
VFGEAFAKNDDLMLRTLKLSSNNIGVTGAAALFIALHERSQRASIAMKAGTKAPILLRRLTLADNPITWRGVRPIHDL